MKRDTISDFLTYQEIMAALRPCASGYHRPRKFGSEAFLPVAVAGKE
jgi:hypothetical protein